MKYPVLAAVLLLVSVVLLLFKKSRAAGFVCLAAGVGLGALKVRLSQWEDFLVRPFSSSVEPVTVTFEVGGSVKDFASFLATRNVVADAGNLCYFLSLFGADRRLAAGGYSLPPGASWQVARQLADAQAVFQQATIVPGAFPATPLGDEWSAEDQANALKDDSLYPEGLRAFLPTEPTARAAFLLPETYSLSARDPRELVKAASAAWWSRFGQFVTSADQAKRTAIIASLLQREAQVDAEYPKVAGVVENRLKKNMFLQIDASVVYAWALKGQKLTRVLYRHLDVDSPYNTYKHKGLPPGPICVPSSAAWAGAFEPEKNDFLYYVADGKGTHTFSKTEKEHLEAVQRYRALQK